MHIDNMLNFI